jgi:hypothetical protein
MPGEVSKFSLVRNDSRDLARQLHHYVLIKEDVLVETLLDHDRLTVVYIVSYRHL